MERGVASSLACGVSLGQRCGAGPLAEDAAEGDATAASRAVAGEHFLLLQCSRHLCSPRPLCTF